MTKKNDENLIIIALYFLKTIQNLSNHQETGQKLHNINLIDQNILSKFDVQELRSNFQRRYILKNLVSNRRIPNECSSF